MKFKNTLLIATLLFSLNVLFFYVSKFTKRTPSSSSTSQLGSNTNSFPYSQSQDITSNVKAIKIKLLENFSWTNDKQTLSLNFSNLLFAKANDNLADICEAFPYTEILLQANKVTINGEHPGILVQTPCQLSNSQLVNFEINIKDIFALEPVDKSIKQPSSHIELRNFDSYWPKQWIIKSVKFYNKSLDGFSINNYELYSYLGYNLEFTSAN